MLDAGSTRGGIAVSTILVDSNLNFELFNFVIWIGTACVGSNSSNTHFGD